MSYKWSTTVRAVLDYNNETGEFRWKARTPELFKSTPRRTAEHACANWNARFAGTIAGTLDKNGYIVIKIFKGYYKAHRLAWLIMTGEWPVAEIDHINLDKADNRFANLREATVSQNAANRRAQSDNTSGFKGVSLYKPSGKWHARIMVKGKSISLGHFDCPAAAHFKYVVEADKHFGEFGRAS